MRLRLLILLVVCISAARAQDTARPYQGFGIETHLLAGKVFKHEQKFTLPIPTLTTGLDINFLLHTSGRKEWEQRCQYPRIGFAVAAIHYGIDSVYGQVFGAYPNITLPLITGRKLEWTLRLGDGIGFVTRKFHRVNYNNTTNVAIGSKVNDFILFNSDIAYHANEHWDIKAGAFITHISNGSVRKPNLGVNVTGISVCASYFPVTSRPVRVVRELKPLSNRLLLQARYSMSLVSSNTPGGPLYPVYIGTGYVSRRWHNYMKAFAGIDYSYHENIAAHLRNNRLESGSEAARAWKSAVIAGNEFLIGRVGVTLQVGAYIRKAYLHRDDVYEKITGNYYFVLKEKGPVKELLVFTALKAHLNVAEMGEMGIGIGL